MCKMVFKVLVKPHAQHFHRKLFITKGKMCQRLSIVTCAENEVRMLNVMISNSMHYLNLTYVKNYLGYVFYVYDNMKFFYMPANN